MLFPASPALNLAGDGEPYMVQGLHYTSTSMKMGCVCMCMLAICVLSEEAEMRQR